ncbi:MULTISPECIES: GNAT family N-acetyltransferase [unclassified Flavobacterium]|uniref:GNAT family N-acetyltransferase n=1 Tax=unclassified Flavobacterium TaxID=196869 RepID=UPI0012A99648|nr:MULTISPECIES: GNAT family N-acetyltransferase [unclassified Flavobacterium]MBF4486191.1 GNAT family N-acetyltransferase [Flavobacterium sp. CSZ]QGK76554.1 GNAT family N-acetyltransferase [Flavobacterium sp. SLB02]
MNSKVEIRKVEKQDLKFVYKAICELENEVLDFKVFEAIFNENISNPKNVYLIAENEIEGLGFISFHTQNLLHHCGLVGEIQEFFIHEKYRGQGIGRLLINEIEDFADLNNLKSIEVTTNKKRVENVAKYESLGFTLSHNKFTIYK